jgi:tRNA(fMet)-specific endonuclease VapC
VFDQLIATHAVSLEVTLVTNHVNDFMNYPDLKVQNWVNQSIYKVLGFNS